MIRLRSRTDVERHQQKQWRRLVSEVLTKAPFYAPYSQRALREYPVVDKATWMKHFDEINTAHIALKEAFCIAEDAEHTRDFTATLGGIAVGMSTGTSGARGIFLASRAERLRWAGTLLAKMLPSGVLASARIALLLRSGSHLYETLSGGMRIKFAYFDLAMPFDRVLAGLESYQPTILVGPPSVLALVADAVTSGGLNIAPQRVVAAAEVLDTVDEIRIKQAFDVPVEQIYQATEGFLGHTCMHGVIHLNEDCLIIERDWIDQATRRFVPIITDLYRSTQPVIRYRLNDILVEREHPCSCGSPCMAIERIEGREDDIVWLASGSGECLVPISPDILSRALLGAFPDVDDYHIEQFAPDALRISVTPLPAAMGQDGIRRALIDCIRRAGAIGADIGFEPWVQPPGTEKRRRVRSVISGSGTMHV
jgi:putative adenylate-forming enzyme